MLGWSHRQGQLHLLLVLPDGSRSWIPACWTDLKTDHDKALGATHPQALIASLSELLHTRTIVDALLRRRGASDEEVPHSGGEEWKGGATEPARTAAPTGNPAVWNALDDKPKTAAIATLVRLIGQVVIDAHAEQEHKHE